MYIKLTLKYFNFYLRPVFIYSHSSALIFIYDLSSARIERVVNENWSAWVCVCARARIMLFGDIVLRRFCAPSRNQPTELLLFSFGRTVISLDKLNCTWCFQNFVCTFTAYSKSNLFHLLNYLRKLARQLETILMCVCVRCVRCALYLRQEREAHARFIIIVHSDCNF